MSSVPSVGRRAEPPSLGRADPTSLGRADAPPPSGGARARWQRRGAMALAALGFALLAVLMSSGLGLVDMARWAAAQQRAFHTMVGELISVREAGPLAVTALIGACFGYGFVHAAIPGHGKFLIAGAGLASRMSLSRLVALSAAASLAQAVSAMTLVYGGFALLDITAGWAMTATDRVLIPLSYLAILAIGLILVRRALRGLSAVAGDLRWRLGHGEEAGCGHRHGPTVAEAEAIGGWRDAVMLIASIGLRPCTGAVFVLVAAWRMDLLAVGAGAAVAMAVGTGAFVSLVALSAVTARGATLFAAGASRARVAVPLLQLVAGAAICLISVSFIAASALDAF